MTLTEFKADTYSVRLPKWVLEHVNGKGYRLSEWIKEKARQERNLKPIRIGAEVKCTKCDCFASIVLWKKWNYTCPACNTVNGDLSSLGG